MEDESGCTKIYQKSRNYLRHIVGVKLGSIFLSHTASSMLIKVCIGTAFTFEIPKSGKLYNNLVLEQGSEG